MKKNLFFPIVFGLIPFTIRAQCSELSLQVSSSDTTYVQLYHAGFFLLPSGFDNICFWKVTTFSGEIVHQDTTFGDAFDQGLTLFNHDVSILDSMKTTLEIVNSTEGLKCQIADTLYWEETEILPGSFIGNWAILSNNTGMEETILYIDQLPSQKEEIQITPTLVYDYFNISGINSIYQMEIYNTSGQLVKSRSNIQNNQKVQMLQLVKGIYFVILKNKSTGHLFSKKLVKL